MAKAKKVQGGMVRFYCPGCKHNIALPVTNESGKTPWGFNNDFEKPTFTPSVLTRYNYGPENKEHVCHSFVRNGKIEFLNDCTHELKGQTVYLPDLEEV